MGALLAMYIGAVSLYQHALGAIVNDATIDLRDKGAIVEALLRALQQQEPPILALDIHRQLIRYSEDVVITLRDATDDTVHQLIADMAESHRIILAASYRLFDELLEAGDAGTEGLE